STPTLELWVTLRRDPKCEAAPGCGWLLRELNRHDEEIRVEAIDLGRTGVTQAMAPVVLDAPDGDVVLSGERQSSAFVASHAFRALPAAPWSPADVFVQVATQPACDAGVCRPRLVVLNTDVEVLVPTIQLSAAEAPWLDTAWLEDRVLHRSAVLAGQLLGEPADR